MVETSRAQHSLTKRPRPFSLSVGVVFIVVGIGAVIDSWTDAGAGAVAALALLLGGCGALYALTTRRAPTPANESE